MISVQHSIIDESSLSGNSKLILQWLPIAQKWIENAFKDTNTHYVFTSETALVNSILEGLYSTNVFALRNCHFSASPEFLLSLPTEVLSGINSMITEVTTIDSEQFNSLLAKYKIYTDIHTDEVINFLISLGVENRVIFKTMSLNGIKTLHCLSQKFPSWQAPTSVTRVAIDFACKYAVCAKSFGDLLEFSLTLYCSQIADSKANIMSPTKEMNVDIIYSALIPFALQRLSCPQLTASDSVNNIDLILNRWGKQQQIIGFTDFPTALNQILNNISHQQLLNTTQ